MCNVMEFPETVEEFMEDYKVVDTEQVYSNGAEYVPIFRMKQWFQAHEAISVEWLLKKRDKNREIIEKLGKEDLDIDFVAKYLYKRASYEVLMIEELLLDWRAKTKD